VKSDLGEVTPERGGKAKRYFESRQQVYGKVRATREDADDMWRMSRVGRHGMKRNPPAGGVLAPRSLYGIPPAK